MRIIQISDCHLPGDPREEYRGENSHENLKHLLKKVKTYAPDLILATGDLSEDASLASYEALQTYFDVLDVPVLALPGNHDDARILERVFPDSPVDKITVTDHGRWQIIRINSCLAGKPEGRVTEQALQQLEQVLQADPDRPRLLALHHQPLPVNSPWIDKYRLFEPEALLARINQTPTVKAVVWGHVHQVFSSRMGSVAMLAGPSSVINSVPGSQKFTADTLGPACRWLELTTDGNIRSGIIAG